MEITLVNSGMTKTVNLPIGSTAGAIRRLRHELEEIGAPSTFTMSVNGVAVNDDHELTHGSRVAFRPDTGTKG